MADANDPTNPTNEEEVVDQPSDLEPEELELLDEPEDVVEDESAEEEPETPPVSRREQLRVQDLLTKFGKKEETPKPTTPQSLNYKDAIDADDDTLQQLEADRQKYGQDLYEQGLEQVRAVRFQTRLEVDAPKVESKYPVLDKGSDTFHPVLADSLNQFYLGMVGYEPKTGYVRSDEIRYADFIESIFEIAEEISATNVQKATKNIAEQAAKTGIRPDGSSAKRLDLNKAPGDMTDEELDAMIAASLPGRR